MVQGKGLNRDLMDNDVSVKVSSELLREVDVLVEKLDFKNREAFVEAAVRRLVDHYRLLLRPLVLIRAKKKLLM